jgi:hypothetical protein
MGRYEEGIPQAKAALEGYKLLCDTAGQAQSLITLALLLYQNQQFDDAEEAASRAIDLSEGGDPTPQHLTTNVGNMVWVSVTTTVCVCNIALNLGNDGVCVRNRGVHLRDTIANVKTVPYMFNPSSVWE